MNSYKKFLLGVFVFCSLFFVLAPFHEIKADTFSLWGGCATVTTTLDKSSYYVGEQIHVTGSISGGNGCLNAAVGASMTPNGTPQPLPVTFTAPNYGGSQTMWFTESSSAGIATSQMMYSVNVPPIPTVTVTASPPQIPTGTTSTISWVASGNVFAGTYCYSTVTGNAGITGSFVTPALTTNTTYTVTCFNPSGNGGGVGVGNTTVIVYVPTPNTTCSSQAVLPTINSGENSQISWTSELADSCNSGGHGTGISGTFNVTPATTTTYPISCTRNAQTLGLCSGTYLVPSGTCGGDQVAGSVCGGQAPGSDEGSSCSDFTTSGTCHISSDPWCHHPCHWIAGNTYSNCSDFNGNQSSCQAKSTCAWSTSTVPSQTVNCNAAVTVNPLPQVFAKPFDSSTQDITIPSGSTARIHWHTFNMDNTYTCDMYRENSLLYSNIGLGGPNIYRVSSEETNPPNPLAHYSVKCNKNNNTYITTLVANIHITPAILPDLTADAPVLPSSVIVNTNIDLPGTIWNIGDTTTEDGFYSFFQETDIDPGQQALLKKSNNLASLFSIPKVFASGGVIDITPAKHLNALDSQESGTIFKNNYKFTTLGRHWVRVCSDKSNRNTPSPADVVESNEGNNCSSYTYIDVIAAPTIPTVITNPITSTTQTSGTAGGNVTSTGGKTVTERGVAYGLSANPTTAGSHTSDGSGTGTFVSTMTGLSPNTPYHYRAYATNSIGTAYGADIVFTTGVNSYALTVTLQGTGTGTVISNPPGISCGMACSKTYNEGTTVVLTPTANNGNPQSYFVGWMGQGINCPGLGTCTVTMNSTKTVIARFYLKPTGVISATDCTIPLGGNDCDSTINWVTYHPIPTVRSQVTTPPNNTPVGPQSNSGTTTYPVAFGSRDFYLYHFGILLDQVTVNATCAANTHWVVNKCIQDIPLPNLIASTPTEDTATVGVATTFHSTITNSSSTSTGLSFINLFQVSPIPNPNVNTTVIDYPVDVNPEMPALGGGLSDTTQKDIIFTSQGNKYVRACADKSSAGDINGKIPESNENDNCSDWQKVRVARGPEVPTVEDPTVSNVMVDVPNTPNYKATLGATVTDKGYPADLSVRGTCYKLVSSGSLPPSINDGASICDPYQDTGSIPLTPFSHVQYSLLPNKSYVFNGYATNSTGTGYSNVNYFSTTGTPLTFIDLIPENPTVLNSGQNAGTFVKFTSIIRNDGADSTGGTFSNIFKVAEQAAGSGTKHIVTSTPQPMSSLNSQSHHLATSSDFLLSGNPGTWSVQACADSAFQISEVNEVNNCSPWVNFEVSPGNNVPGQCDILPYWCVVPLGFVNGTKVGNTFSWTCQGQPDDICSYTYVPPAGCLAQHFGCVSGNATNKHNSTGIGDPWTWECPSAASQCSEVYVPSCPANTHQDPNFPNDPTKCICNNGAHNPPSCKGPTYIER